MRTTKSNKEPGIRVAHLAALRILDKKGNGGNGIRQPSPDNRALFIGALRANRGFEIGDKSVSSAPQGGNNQADDSFSSTPSLD